MAYVPVMLEVRGRRCVVIGGGAVAARRAKALAEAGADVTVVAPALSDGVRALGVGLRERPATPEDVAGAFLVVLATDDPAANASLAAAASRAGALVNRADEPEAASVQFMAAWRSGPLTLGVHTGGVSAAAAAAIRDDLAAAVDPAWPRLLEAAAPYRARLQASAAEGADRQRLLARLADAAAMDALKSRGEAGLREHLDRLVADAARPEPA